MFHRRDAAARSTCAASHRTSAAFSGSCAGALESPGPVKPQNEQLGEPLGQGQRPVSRPAAHVEDHRPTATLLNVLFERGDGLSGMAWLGGPPGGLPLASYDLLQTGMDVLLGRGDKAAVVSSHGVQRSAAPGLEQEERGGGGDGDDQHDDRDGLAAPSSCTATGAEVPQRAPSARAGSWRAGHVGSDAGPAPCCRPLYRPRPPSHPRSTEAGPPPPSCWTREGFGLGTGLGESMGPRSPAPAGGVGGESINTVHPLASEAPPEASPPEPQVTPPRARGPLVAQEGLPGPRQASHRAAARP